MLARRLLHLSIATTLVAAAGCDRAGVRGKGRITSVAGAGVPVRAAGVVSSNGGSLVSSNGGSLIATNGAGVVSTNGAAITGIVTGPSASVLANHAAGVLANNSAALLGNNTASLIANNAAGLVGNNTAGIVAKGGGSLVAKGGGLYALAHAGHPEQAHAPRLAASAFVPVGGATVEAFDLAGNRVSREPARTGPDGAFVFPAGALGPSTGPLIFRAVVTIGARTVTLEALVPGGAAASEAIAMTPATTLVAKKARALAASGALPAGALGAASAARLAAALAPYMSERVAVAAVLVEPAIAGQVFDAMTAASDALAADLADAGADADGTALLARAPTISTSPSEASAPTPGPTATPRSGGGTGGGGNRGGSDPAPTPTPLADGGAAITLDDFYVASRIAGDGTHGSASNADPLHATFGEVGGVAVAPDGTVYFTDVDHHQIRRRTAAGVVELVAGQPDEGLGFAGDGRPASEARFHFPLGLAFDGGRDVLLVADHDNNRIRAFSPGGRISTLVGGGGDGSETVASALDASLDGPAGVALDPNGWLFFTEHNRVRRMAPTGALTTLAGIGNGGGHWPLAVDPARQIVWYGDGASVYAVTNARGAAVAAPTPVFTAVGTGPGDPRIAGLATDRRGRLYVLQVAEDGGQPRDVRLFRLLTDADGFLRAGAAAEAIAGTGGTSADESAFILPAAGGVLNALDQLLPGIGGCNLAIDLSAADDPAALAGQLYLGGSAEFGGETAGQLIRLDPRDTGAIAP